MEKDYDFSAGFVQDLRAIANMVYKENPDSIAKVTICNEWLDITAEIRFKFKDNGKI